MAQVATLEAIVKVYRRKEFLALPEGMIYAKGKPWYFDGLQIKFDTSHNGNDWWSLDPSWIASEKGDDAFVRLDEMLEKGSSYPMQDAISRDGLNDESDLFLVFEVEDLRKLGGMIDAAIVAAEGVVLNDPLIENRQYSACAHCGESIRLVRTLTGPVIRNGRREVWIHIISGFSKCVTSPDGIESYPSGPVAKPVP